MSVEYEVDGKTAIITLNNPAKLNAINLDMFAQLGHHLRAAAADPNIYITLLTGKGRFFSSGADIANRREPEPGEDKRRGYVQNFSRILDLTNTFYTHSNILITALNGPVVGLTAALITHSDFIYAAPHTYLLAPFTSLGLVVEGGGSRSFANRMGVTKAKEALIMSRRIPAEELLACGFLNGIFPANRDGSDSEAFRTTVMNKVCREQLDESNLSSWSMLRIKELMGRTENHLLDGHVLNEVLGGVDALSSGVPQKEFAKMKKKQKQHKL
ncbi:hypothetical protein M409DRAFT_66091 [Zasmidium cellare ATCC 36951]|uniref:Enoyl-CoA hydratase n=1 Tax=Zasmidium cellare ATCC 36951 TaxID=1080233 RepID=A0A6A6CNX6_ZASCE|nr:uncharacterized protein M409DRAFT_66091 [Zasmidium cellare ATCC 36951]KAF2167602.1 hypothetical protein M409DRAFT_66091 [Zasmidium cellare ATCC 36951]